MDTQHILLALLVTVVAVFLTRYLISLWPSDENFARRAGSSQSKAALAAARRARLEALPPPPQFILDLASSLPAGRVVLPKDVDAYLDAMDVHFSMNNREIEPACVVQPRSVDEVATAIKHLAREHKARKVDFIDLKKAGGEKRAEEKVGLFAVRCSGANPAEGIAGVKDGVVLDLARLNSIELGKDRDTVDVGGGCKWTAVFEYLEKRGLSCVGGRSHWVGVGGSTLGGGISYYSGHYGFMCSNVVSYTVVLADGTITTASSTTNTNLWRALKGGVNNFGVVVSFKLRCFPGADMWFGSTILPGFRSKSALQAYYDYGMSASKRKEDGGCFDPDAATPILSTVFIPDLHLSLMHLNLATVNYAPSTAVDSTLLAENGNDIGSAEEKTKKRSDWPKHWKDSPFHALWPRVGNTFTQRTVSEAVYEMGALSKRDQRNGYGVCGFKLNLKTLLATYEIWKEEYQSVKHIRGGMTFVYNMQLLNPMWMHKGLDGGVEATGKGKGNVLGLDNCDEPLVVVGCCVNWSGKENDAALKGAIERACERITKVSKEHGSWHPYRVLNYAGATQYPLEGYGQDNLEMMREVSKEVDPEGLFQTGCLGGYKLNREDL